MNTSPKSVRIDDDTLNRAIWAQTRPGERYPREFMGAHGKGLKVMFDLVLNHTAKEHAWAKKAAKGDAVYQDYYLKFDSDDLPKRYEQSLVEVFPDNAPGNFTHYPDIGKWVWTTFNEHQWDLNWANPAVFLEIVEVMLFLANKGVDVLRLDAVAFMWKRLGTRCQSEPEVHMILQALRACSRIAAPAVIHLEEAIVSPQEMLPYLGRGKHESSERWGHQTKQHRQHAQSDAKDDPDPPQLPEHHSLPFSIPNALVKASRAAAGTITTCLPAPCPTAVKASTCCSAT